MLSFDHLYFMSSMKATHTKTIAVSMACAVAFSIQLAGCSPRNEGANADKQKIAALEREIAELKAAAASAKPATVAAEAAPSSTTAPASTPESEPDAVGSQWSYSASEEKMTGGVIKTASVSSSNTVEFDFPYTGAQHGRLILRTSPRHGKDVIFRIERGQLLCTSYDGCSVQVRFDDDKPVRYSATGPADGSSEVLFIDNYSGFLNRLKKAKRVRLSASIYQQGAPIFEFDVSGFSVERYSAKS